MALLGLSKKKIDEKIDDITDFAEIGEFIDTPVQNYKWTASFDRANYQP